MAFFSRNSSSLNTITVSPNWTTSHKLKLKSSKGIIRNGFMPHIMGHKLSHIYAREVRWNFEFDSWYSSKICLCLSKKNLHSLYVLFLIMSTLKGDVRVKIFHFTIFLFWPYVKKGEYCIEFVCRNVIF